MTPADRALVLDAVRAAARELPHAVLEDLCARIERLAPDASPAQRRAVAEGLGGAYAREVALALVARWDAARVAPQAFAWALRGVADMDAWHRARQRLELVWTGPMPAGSTLRRIDQGLLEVIERARRSLVVVTFTAWELPTLRAALQAALDRGVRLTFVVETREDSGGRFHGDVRAALGAEILARAVVYVWPPDQRPRDGEGRQGSLHAKCALADDAVLLVSSANLTEHAMRLNMELGLLVEGGDVPARVGAHLRGLMDAGALHPAALATWAAQ